MAFYDTVAGVHGGGLADGDVLGLGFGDFDFGLEALGIGDAGEVGTGSDVLADLDGNELEDTLDTGANVEGVEFAFLEIVKGALLIDLGLLSLDACTRGVLGVLGTVVFQLDTNGELFFLYPRELLSDLGADALGAELGVHFVLDFGLLILTANGGGSGFLVEELAVDSDLETFEVGLGGLELVFRVQRFALENGIAELKDDAVRLNDGAGIEKLTIDTRIGLRGDPANVFGDEGADAANVANHGATFDFVSPDGGFVDGRSGGAKAGDTEGDTGERDDGDGDIEDAPDFLGVGVGWSLYVHSFVGSTRSAMRPWGQPA